MPQYGGATGRPIATPASGGWTEADLAAVQNAILALAEGKRTTMAQIGGRMIQYQQAQLADLRALRAEIMKELEDAGGTPRYTLTTNLSKGL